MGVIDTYVDNNSFSVMPAANTCPYFMTCLFTLPVVFFDEHKALNLMQSFFPFTFSCFLSWLENTFLPQDHKGILLYVSSRKDFIVLTSTFKFLIQLG